MPNGLWLLVDNVMYISTCVLIKIQVIEIIKVDSVLIFHVERMTRTCTCMYKQSILCMYFYSPFIIFKDLLLKILTPPTTTSIFLILLMAVYMSLVLTDSRYNNNHCFLFELYMHVCTSLFVFVCTCVSMYVCVWVCELCVCVCVSYSSVLNMY